MQHDYKFLSDGSARPALRLRPRGHHIAIIALVAAVVGILIALLPIRAGAYRSENLSPSKTLALPAVTAPATGENSIQLGLDLPPEAVAAAAPPAAEPEADAQWQTTQVKNGESLAHIFARLQLSPQELHTIIHLNEDTARLRKVFPGDEIRVRMDGENRLQELVYALDETHRLQVLRQGDGFHSQRIQLPVETRINHASARIDSSLFLAGQKAGLSDNMIMRMAGIFGWDVDFALDIREGDHFTLLFEELYLHDEKLRDGEILAAEFHNNGTTYRAIRYIDAQGNADYYAPDGTSMRKAFLRTPVEFSRISSGFDLNRKHPVLNRIRAHMGVDYAAPTGTPIRATGDGRVVFRGRKGGYGNAIEIQHGSAYSTLYAHLSRFNASAKSGSRVRQGQIIGYVGSTGLATGPHLHYEFRVHGVHRNPLTVKLPHAQPLPKQYQADFTTKAQEYVSQLNLVRDKLIALNQ